jgi:hypothetical protein
MKKIFIGLLILIAVSGASYYYVMHKPHKSVADETAIIISAQELFAAFSSNEQAANSKYLNKALEVKGIISSIDENQDKQPYIVLQTDDMMYGIMCTMHSKEIKAQKGETIIVKGFCSGLVGDVKLTDCIISQANQ